MDNIKVLLKSMLFKDGRNFKPESCQSLFFK